MRKIRIMTTVTIGICPIVESSSSGGFGLRPRMSAPLPDIPRCSVSPAGLWLYMWRHPVGRDHGGRNPLVQSRRHRQRILAALDDCSENLCCVASNRS